MSHARTYQTSKALARYILNTVKYVNKKSCKVKVKDEERDIGNENGNHSGDYIGEGEEEEKEKEEEKEEEKDKEKKEKEEEEKEEEHDKLGEETDRRGDFSRNRDVGSGGSPWCSRQYRTALVLLSPPIPLTIDYTGTFRRSR